PVRHDRSITGKDGAENLADIRAFDAECLHVADRRHELPLDDALIGFPRSLARLPLAVLVVRSFRVFLDVALGQFLHSLGVALLPNRLGRIDALLGRAESVLGLAPRVGELLLAVTAHGTEAHRPLRLASLDAVADDPRPSAF